MLIGPVEVMKTKVICYLAASVGLALTVPRDLVRRGREIGAALPPSGRRNLLRLAKVGPISVGPATTVMEAVRRMHQERVGAVLIAESGTLEGILTERDIMLRVVLRGRNPKKTPVSRVMTTAVTVIDNHRTPDHALQLMSEKNIRHLPIVGPSGKVEGMLSLRHLLGQKVEHLEGNLDSLAAYISADGIGG
jgi:CBS domain-containing protein